ncbi:lymphocyte antigen 6D isoform X1 [Choloepus didactylus]|uniref:lymphocyte antigen 6D isoform X1 n=1 Tax=Choloepus didactylus TaxID=27675 RepID=UPI00189E8B20|nr:lymphocyte antigen 6D isoform X1 [Choloepus didactylus]
MKTILLLFAALAMAARPARALQCHVCSSSTNCRQPQPCSLASRFCKTVIKVETLSGNLVQKECAEWCTPGNTAQGQVSSGKATVSCCQEDLCNSRLSSAASTRGPLAGTTLGLALALGLLTLILDPSP